MFKKKYFIVCLFTMLMILTSTKARNYKIFMETDVYKLYNNFSNDTATFTYPKAGKYKVKIVAHSGGTSVLIDSTIINIVLNRINLPITYNNPNIDYTTIDFGGNTTIEATDPTHSNNKVKKTTKPANAEIWAGVTITGDSGLAKALPLKTTRTKIIARVYAPNTNLPVRLKIEDQNDSNKSVETEAFTQKANEWDTLIFDFNQPVTGSDSLNDSYSYRKMSLFFDFGNTGTERIFYFDNIYSPVSEDDTILFIPVNFDNPNIDYASKINNFNGGNFTITDNPNASGINPSLEVGKMVKELGATWAGSYLTLDSAIDFKGKNQMKLKVYSPRVGARVLLKVENLNDGGIFFEREAVTTLANQWEELVFDYSLIDKTQSYQKIILIFDNGIAGDGSPNYTFYIDDITTDYFEPLEAIKLPLDFEMSAAEYKLINFNGGNTTVISNPYKSGLNTSNQVAKMVKGPGGEIFGGSWISLYNPLEFTSKIFKILVYAPKIGTKVLLKLEKENDANIFMELTAITTKANEWEELSFDFSSIDLSNGRTYQKVVIIFDLGTIGDGTANFTYYFDNLRQENSKQNPIITTTVVKGVISSSDSVMPGNTIRVTYSGNSGYSLDSVIVNGRNIGVDSTTGYTFRNVQGDSSIRVVYKLIKYNLFNLKLNQPLCIDSPGVLIITNNSLLKVKLSITKNNSIDTLYYRFSSIEYRLALKAGNYRLKIVDTGLNYAEQNYEFSIKEPEPINNYSILIGSNKEINIPNILPSMYLIINNKQISTSEIQGENYPLVKGVNKIVLKNSIGCLDSLVKTIVSTDQTIAYPNPVLTNVTIVVGSEETDLLWELYTLSGQKLASSSATLSSDHKFMINMTDYNKGVYILKIQGKEYHTEVKLIKN